MYRWSLYFYCFLIDAYAVNYYDAIYLFILWSFLNLKIDTILLPDHCTYGICFLSDYRQIFLHFPLLIIEFTYFLWNTHSRLIYKNYLSGRCSITSLEKLKQRSIVFFKCFLSGITCKRLNLYSKDSMHLFIDNIESLFWFFLIISSKMLLILLKHPLMSLF